MHDLWPLAGVDFWLAARYNTGIISTLNDTIVSSTTLMVLHLIIELNWHQLSPGRFDERPPPIISQPSNKYSYPYYYPCHCYFFTLDLLRLAFNHRMLCVSSSVQGGVFEGALFELCVAC